MIGTHTRFWLVLMMTTLLLVACGHASRGTPPAIIDSEIAFFAKGFSEKPGYGRYTYVLLARAQPTRASKFLNDLFQSISFQGGTGLTRVRLNLFEVPVKYAKVLQFYRSRSNGNYLARLAIEAYDYDRSVTILDAACVQSDPRYARICKSSRTVGPYLLSYAHPVQQMNAITMPYLIVDLSGVDTKAFPYFIARMMEQVQDPNITASARIYSFRGFLLSWLLQFNKVERPLREQIVQLVPKATGS